VAASIADFAFDPMTLSVTKGTTVTWTNSDGAGHTVTADDGSFNGATAGGGGTFSHLFTTTGTFAYHCAIHPSMTGTVIVSGQ